MQAVIFDLDNCLSPAIEVGEALYQPAFAAIRAANVGCVPESALDAAFSDIWRQPYDWVARRYGFTRAMFEAGWQVFMHTEVTARMAGYPDLAMLRLVPGERFLVTTGFERLQASKIRALGIGGIFSEVRIDAIDAPVVLGKKQLFLDIIEKHGFEAGDVVVVGDNPESELAAGKALGMTTVQLLRPGVEASAMATVRVRNLRELISWLKSLSSASLL